jgi:hypothetical protein
MFLEIIKKVGFQISAKPRSLTFEGFGNKILDCKKTNKNIIFYF